jgi:hypothetical protein
MKNTTKNFGNYQVKVNGKTQKVDIYYVWSARDKELFKSDLTASSALTCLRDYYLTPSHEAYAAAKEFFMPMIANEY